MKKDWGKLIFSELDIEMTLGGKPGATSEYDPAFKAWNFIQSTATGKHNDYFTNGQLNAAGLAYIADNAGS